MEGDILHRNGVEDIALHVLDKLHGRNLLDLYSSQCELANACYIGCFQTYSNSSLVNARGVHPSLTGFEQEKLMEELLCL